MKILIGCEYSGVVRDAFIAQGHEAISCDVIPTEARGPHINGDLLEEIDGVDVLFVPVGGVYTINPEEASKLVSKIEASIVIPMHFYNKKLKTDVFGKLAPVSEFLQKIDAGDIEPIGKLTVKKADFSEEESKVVVLTD